MLMDICMFVINGIIDYNCFRSSYQENFPIVIVFPQFFYYSQTLNYHDNYFSKLELCRAHTPRALYSHCSVVLQYSAAELFYDLTTLSNTELEHAQSHQHAKRVGVVDKPQAC